MSAGDVLFVGWTGGTPNYKELAPQIQIEPSAIQGYINKRVTINRICFDKDKPAVIGNLPTGNATLSSVYIDTDGSVKTQALGGGYTLLSISDASIAKGFSRVSAQYSKTSSALFEIGLPEGLSITCESGVCKIKYLTHTLEEIDNGTGECTSGLDLQINQRENIFVGANVFTRQFADSQTYFAFSLARSGIIRRFIPTDPRLVYQTVVNADFLALNKTIFDCEILCNGTIFETTKLTNGDVFDTFELVYVGEPLSSGVYQASAEDDPLTEEEITSLKNEATFFYEENPIDGTTLESIELKTFASKILVNAGGVSGGQIPVLQEYPIYYRLMPTYKLTHVKWDYVPQLEWKKTGNKITLQYGKAIIREYDVTGLT